ncbi:MAG: hypothetical protein ACLRXQ_11910 [Phascolarctobacterium faecium]
MDINIVTTVKTDEEARELLRPRNAVQRIRRRGIPG